jgi:AcrR family transcriptional regulator
MNDSTRPTGSRLVERRRLELAEDVMRIAVEAFLELGYESVSVAEICARAGISQSTFFRTFAGKPAIVSGAFEITHELIAQRMRDSTDGSLLSCYLTAFREHFVTLALVTPTALAANTGVVTRPEVRGVFLDSIAAGPRHPFAVEIARRLQVEVEDPRVATVRAIIWVATDLAMTSIAPDGDLEDLVADIRGRLSGFVP